MKILRIITRLNTGGPAVQCLALTKNTKQSILVTGLVPDNEDNQFEEQAKRELKDKIVFIPELKRELSFKNDLIALYKIYQVISAYKPDIVHTHTSKAGFIGRLAALLVSPKIKLVNTFHGHTLYGYFSKSKELLFRSIERALALFTNRIIAISESQKQDLIDYKICRSRKIVVVPLGFHLNQFLKLKNIAFQRRNRIRVAFVGRLTEIKNPERFISFVETLREKLNIEVWIVGNGELKGKIKPKTKDIRFIDFFDYQTLPEVYKNLDIVVCSSRNEGTPVVLIEAMASGRLVISTKVGGCVDLIGSNYERGLYLEETSPEDIDWLLNDKYGQMVLRSILSRAREYVCKYQFNRLLKDIEKIYHAL